MTDWAAKVLEGVPEDAFAKIVYEAMRFERKDETPKWVERGNSTAQTEARAAAAKIQAYALAAIAKLGAGDDMVERLLENDREIFLPLLGEAAAHIAALRAKVAQAEKYAHDAGDRVVLAEKITKETQDDNAALRAKVARLEGALTDMPKAVLRTTVCQGPQWPDDRPGVWLAALEACAKSVQTAVNAAIPAATRPVQDDAASRRRKIMGHMNDRAAADARAEALKEALQALRGAGSFGRTAAEKHAALEQYCLCRDAILALIPEKQP